MSSLNKVILIARLARDVELRQTARGTAVTMSAATSRKWTDKNTGEKMEEVDWHRLVAYDRLAEIMGNYLQKGSLAYFEGRLKTRKWQDKDGIDKYTTEVIVEQMQMLGGREEQGEDNHQAPAPVPARPRSAALTSPPERIKPALGKTAFDDMDEDLPF